jgi:hypothetical protein
MYFVEASVMVLAGQREHYLRLQWRLNLLFVADSKLLMSLVALPFECPKHQEYPVPNCQDRLVLLSAFCLTFCVPKIRNATKGTG